MSQLRLGRLPDGTRHVLLLEPATARRQGHGGVAAGFFSRTVLTPAKRSPEPLREKDWRRKTREAVSQREVRGVRS